MIKIVSYSFLFVILVCCATQHSNSKKTNNTLDDQTNIEKDSLEVIKTFYASFLEERNYVKYYNPEIKKVGKVYQMNLTEYLENLRASKFFTHNFIINDSIKLFKCVQQFNSKRYSEDLEAMFFDDCPECMQLNPNEYYGGNEEIISYIIDEVITESNGLLVRIKCRTDTNSYGDGVEIRLKKENGKYLIDGFMTSLKR